MEVPQATKTVKTTKTTVAVNLRGGPGTGHKVLKRIPGGTAVTTLRTSGRWTRATVGGSTGWIMSRFLKTTTKTVTVRNYRYVTADVRAYKAVGGSGGTVAKLAVNTRVELLATSGKWSRVRTGTMTGWMTSARLSTSRLEYRWTREKVNLRPGADTGGKSLGVVPAWERIVRHKSSGAWTLVTTSRGMGWIKSSYLSKTRNYPVAVYGTLRKGQSAYFLLKGKTTAETKTRIVGHNLYLKPTATWWSFLVPSSNDAHQVVAERMTIRTGSYTSTVAALDSWERFDPSKPLADQNYNRKLVTDTDGNRVYAYVAGRKIASYMAKRGIKVKSGDYLRRY